MLTAVLCQDDSGVIRSDAVESPRICSVVWRVMSFAVAAKARIHKKAAGNAPSNRLFSMLTENPARPPLTRWN